MRTRRWLLAMSAVGLLLLSVLGPPAGPAQAATPTFYTDRASYEAALDTMITDPYDAPPYPSSPAPEPIYGDAVFSAFFGETDYRTTNVPDHNRWLNEVGGSYTGVGSFELLFQTTSVSQGSGGVYGVGLDVVRYTPSSEHSAFITYGDGTTSDATIPPAGSFFGVSAPQGIISIHFGLAGGEPASASEFSLVIDNLTIGNGIGLGDLAWNDSDQDGMQDAGEPGIGNIAVDLLPNGSCVGPPIASGETDANGNYFFTDLQSGTYCLEFHDIPAGWLVTLPNQGADDTLDSDADLATWRIVNIALTGMDLDQDIGLYLPEEEGAEAFVPEPGTLLLLGSGLAGLFGYVTLRRRRD